MDINKEIKDNQGLIGKVLKDIHFRNIRFDDYEELYSAGRIGLYNGIKSYNGSVKKSTYYYKCIKNEILKEIQLKNTKKRVFQDTLVSIDYEYEYKTILDELADDIDLEKDIIIKETREDVRKVIEKLDPKHQTALKLHFGIGCNPCSFTQMGKITGTTPQNMELLYKSAKRRFEKEWRKYENSRCKK